MRVLFFIVVALFFQIQFVFSIEYSKVKVGAERMDQYLPILMGKKVAIIANHTSFVGKTHLVDTLLSLGVDVKKIFAPEHGFRGIEDAGGTVKNSTDIKTGLPVISLYGKNKKPTVEQLGDIEIVIFDIQDVGARFYTYISTMHLAMEACAENEKTLLVLDRPNPNGYFIDGPVLDIDYKSFIGMHPIPIVHGLTVAELAVMINGESWLSGGEKCDLKYVTCEDYDHNKIYELPIKPSPNLPNMISILYYPTLCLLEGSVLSVGRGTEKPFQYVGHPELSGGSIKFVPRSMSGAKHPKLEGKECVGYDINDKGIDNIVKEKKIDLAFLLKTYEKSPKEKFFRISFNKLAGNDLLQKQIKLRKGEDIIRESWKDELEEYKKMRKKYLLYADFE